MVSPTPSLRQKRAVLLATGAAVIVTLVVLYLLGNIILTIGLSALIAYTLLPVVRLLERAMPWRKRHPDLSRVSAIVIMFLVGLAAVAGILLVTVPLIVREFGMFVDEFPQFFRTARLTVENWIAIYADRIPEEIKQDLEDAIAKGGNILVGAAWDAAEKTLGVVSRSLSLIIGLATLPILVFYLMKNSGAVHPAVCAPFPSAMHVHLRAMLDIVDQTFGAYIRGQLTLGLVVGIIVAVGLFLLGVPFSILLGIIAGITELIPIIGPWIGGAAGVIVTLATAPEKALWVAPPLFGNPVCGERHSRAAHPGECPETPSGRSYRDCHHLRPLFRDMGNHLGTAPGGYGKRHCDVLHPGMEVAGRRDWQPAGGRTRSRDVVTLEASGHARPGAPRAVYDLL